MSLNHGVKEFSREKNEERNAVNDSNSGIFRSHLLTGVFKHSFELLLAHVFVITDFIQVRGYVNVRSQE